MLRYRSIVLVLVGVAVGWCGQYIVCPDGQVCDSLDTCCRTPTGYGCCPYPQAVCCSDLIHCCPNRYTCDTTGQMCRRGGHPLLSVPMRQKIIPGGAGRSLPTLPLSRLGQGGAAGGRGLLVHCGGDDDGLCPAGTACCRQPGGAQLCCPVSAGSSYPLIPRGSPVRPATKTSSPGHTSLIRPNENQRAGSNGVDVVRCNAFFYCPAGTSCCQGATDQWSCCPYPLGHCCSDGIHCCENGYTCDVPNLKCRKGFTNVPSGTKKDAERF